MILVFLVIFSFLPLVFWIALSAKRHHVPLSRSVPMIFAGLAAIAVASVAQTLLDPVTMSFTGRTGLFFSSFIESAFIEELSKLLFVSLFTGGRKRGKPVTAREILACAITLGLAFSAFETLAYAIRSPSIIWIRTLIALPVHASAAVAAGALVAAFRTARAKGSGEHTGWDTEAGAQNVVSPGTAAFLFFCAVSLHGFYNYWLSYSASLLFPALIAVVSLVAIAFRLWQGTDSPA